MKKLIVTLLSITLSWPLMAQQLPQFSQYMLNDYVLNPAITGTQDYFEARLNYRQNWVGFDGAPATQILSFQGPISDNKMGVGGFIFNDMTGPIRRSGIEGTYAYKLPIGEQHLSLGVAAGVFNYFADKDEIKTESENEGVADPTLNNNSLSVIVPDARFGVYFYGDKYWVGASVPQLIPAKVQFASNDQVEVASKLKRHYYLMGGYRFDINEKFSIEPSVFAKAVPPAPIQVDFNARFFYQKSYWVGFSYRTNDAVVGLLGLTFKKKFHLGYAYDFTISGLSDYSSGSHEIMLGYNFGVEEEQRSAAPRL